MEKDKRKKGNKRIIRKRKIRKVKSKIVYIKKKVKK